VPAVLSQIRSAMAGLPHGVGGRLTFEAGFPLRENSCYRRAVRDIARMRRREGHMAGDTQEPPKPTDGPRGQFVDLAPDELLVAKLITLDFLGDRFCELAETFARHDPLAAAAAVYACNEKTAALLYSLEQEVAKRVEPGRSANDYLIEVASVLRAIFYHAAERIDSTLKPS
jgi:hypothetical protein